MVPAPTEAQGRLSPHSSASFPCAVDTAVPAVALAPSADSHSLKSHLHPHETVPSRDQLDRLKRPVARVRRRNTDDQTRNSDITSSYVGMRIPIREQLGLLVLVTSLMAVAVISIVTVCLIVRTVPANFFPVGQ
jgi:hypothetical protein